MRDDGKLLQPVLFDYSSRLRQALIVLGVSSKSALSNETHVTNSKRRYLN